MRQAIKYIFLAAMMTVAGCQSGKDDSTSEFIIHPDFNIICIASEPLISVPVEMEMDKEGNLWVVELTGYMRDIDGSEENKADGKIVKLEDTNDDGIMDKRNVILDGLMAPRAICLINNGLLYTDGEMLKWSDRKGTPSSRVVVDSFYVTGSNIEHQPNGLYYHIDNWIYSARSNTRYQFRDSKWVKEITHFRGQWGISSDEIGRLVYNDNSNLIRGDGLLPGMILNNPHLEVNYSIGRRLTSINRVNPLQPTSVNRGYQTGVLDNEGKLINATSACSPLIYVGNNFGEEYSGDAFVCIPEINSVKHLDIKEENGRLIAINDTTGLEFLASQDETFRPVNLHNGPDGAIYVIDMRKGIIQHRAYMTDYLRENILQKNLEQVVGKGRIYRIIKKKQEEVPRPATLIEAIQSHNGYVRLNAQKRIIEENHTDLVGDLKTIALSNGSDLSRIHALWALEGLQELDGDLLEDVMTHSDHPGLLSHVLWLSDKINLSTSIKSKLISLSSDVNDPFLDIMTAHFIARWSSDVNQVMSAISSEKYKVDSLFAEALVSGLRGKEQSFQSIYTPLSGNDTISQVLSRAINAKLSGINHLPTGENIFYDSRTEGLELYSQYCSSCHRMDGKGQNGLAPPLVKSMILEDDPRKAALVVLQGLQGPIHAGGRKFNMNVMMPGLKSNPQLSDQDVADIIHFVRNAFVAKWTRLDSTDVKSLRTKVEGRMELFTEEELMELCF